MVRSRGCVSGDERYRIKGKRCKEEVVLGLGSMRGECIALPYMYSTIM